jgi:RNA polymerase sigma-70 factor (ECF subfamily)
MQPTNPADDLGPLLDEVRAGDDAALSRLLQQYEPRLRTAARVLLGPFLRPHLDSIDLVQSVHRELLPGLREGKYDLSSSQQLLGLALTVIRRKVARNWRRLQREQKLGSLPENPDAPPETALASRHADDDPLANALVNDAIQTMLRRLGADDRRLVERRLQGHSTTDIAQELNCDPHILRARLSRLRQKLRAEGFADWL